MKLRKVKGKGPLKYGYKSPLEYSVFRTLKSLTYGTVPSETVPNKFKITYEDERLAYVLPKVYVPDFILSFKDGTKIYIEVKGYFRQPDRTKILAVLRSNPDLDLRLVFEKNNKLNRRAKMRYSDWCERHDIPYSINSIPLEWFK